MSNGSRTNGIPTDIKVGGRKQRVTNVMILMEMVSCFVFTAISCISAVMRCMFSVDDLFASVF